jgi:hypothetical protein
VFDEEPVGIGDGVVFGEAEVEVRGVYFSLNKVGEAIILLRLQSFSMYFNSKLVMHEPLRSANLEGNVAVCNSKQTVSHSTHQYFHKR